MPVKPCNKQRNRATLPNAWGQPADWGISSDKNRLANVIRPVRSSNQVETLRKINLLCALAAHRLRWVQPDPFPFQSHFVSVQRASRRTGYDRAVFTESGAVTR